MAWLCRFSELVLGDRSPTLNNVEVSEEIRKEEKLKSTIPYTPLSVIDFQSMIVDKGVFPSCGNAVVVCACRMMDKA